MTLPNTTKIIPFQITTTLPPGDLDIWVKVKSITGTEAIATTSCKVGPSSSTGQDLVDKVKGNIKNSLDNTDEISGAVTTAAQQARDVGLEQTVSSNFRRRLFLLL